MSQEDDYFSSIGNTFSASDNPDEYARYLDKQAEKQRREQEKEQARLLKEQQDRQAALQRDTLQKLNRTAIPQPSIIDNNDPAPAFKSNPDDPLGGIPEEKRRDILLNKYDTRHHQPTDYFGQQLSPDKSNEYIGIWKNRVKEASGDVIDILLQQNMNRNPAIKKQVEEARRDFQQWLPQPDIQTLEYRLDGKAGENIARTTDYRPERDGLPQVQNAFLTPDQPIQIVKTNNLYSQAASVNDPEDQSMGRLYDYLNEHAIEPMKGNESWERHPAGHSDNSYGQAEKMAGEAVGNYLDNSLGVGQPVNGKDGTRPAGEQNQSYGPFFGDVSKNMGMESAVTGKGRDVIGPPNMTYWQNWSDEQSRKIPLTLVKDGVKQGVNDAKILFFSGAVIVGKTLYDLIGGDPASLRKTENLLDQCQREAKNMKPLEMKEIYVQGNPEKTMQNVTRYLYQELGNQLVKVPAYFIAGKLKTIAELTGASTPVIAAQIHADIRDKTGESRVGESVMYAIPLGLMSAMLWPLRENIRFSGAKETMDYVASMISSASVHTVQDIGKGMVVNRYKDSNRRNN